MHNLRRSAGSVSIVLGIISLAAGLYLQITPKLYQASVRIAVQKDVPDVVAATGGDPTENAGVDFDPYWLQTQFGPELRTEVTYRVLKEQLEARQVRCTSLIEIRFSSVDRHEAAVVANEIARVYLEGKHAKRRELQLESKIIQDKVGSFEDHAAVEIIDRAEAPDRPYYPNPAHSILLSGAGLVGIVGGFFLRKAR